MKNMIPAIALTTTLLLGLGANKASAMPAIKAPEAITAAKAITTPEAAIAAKANAPIELITARFHNDFRNAELLTTESGRSYIKLKFKMNGAILYAYYSGNGDLLAVTHNLSSTDLPIGLLLQLKRDYPNYWITDLFELVANDSNGYYITLENASTQLILRSADGSWETYRKTNK